MQIIHKGTPPQERKYRVTCGTCDTIFEFAQSEGKISYAPGYRNEDDMISINCPICSNLCYTDLSNYIKQPTATDYYNK